MHVCRFLFALCLALVLEASFFSFLSAIAGPSAIAGEEDGVAEQNLVAEEQSDFWATELKPFLETYCYDCHSGEGAEAEIDFTKYDSAEDLSSERPRWNQIRGMIEIGAMPPADYSPLPEISAREKIADWIDRRVNSVDCEIVHDAGRVTMRRLNNVEYDNTIRDLLGFEESASKAAGLPTDGVGNGFDNQGDVLTLSPLQLEKYLSAAQYITSRLIIRDPRELKKQFKNPPSIYLGDTASVSYLFNDGEYELRTGLQFRRRDGESDATVRMLVDGEQVAEWHVDGERKPYSTTHRFTAGEHEISIEFVDAAGADGDEFFRFALSIEYVSMEGPKGGTPALPRSHQNLFVAYPSDDKSVEEAAREIFTPLIRRAFRREPRELDIERVVNIVKMSSDQGRSFEDSVAWGLQSVLVSPYFLFRIEEQSGDEQVSAALTEEAELVQEEKGQEAGAALAADPLEVEAIGDFAMASRLSYFLWSSMPDDELLDLAARGELQNQSALRAQANRMLRDKKAQSLVQRFFGQYLALSALDKVEPDVKQFPLWSEGLRGAIKRETELFCQEIVDQDLSIDTLLDGEFTYVNPRLAELYGMDFDGTDPRELYRQGPGRRAAREQFNRDQLYRDEDRWIRVSVPAQRKGVLTHASILTLTSNPTTTSPVKRGKWILETILGDPPPPAPPNVPSLEATKDGHQELSLREQLEIHRENPSCASCHNVMDPLGLGFENFDAIGQWRDKDGPHPIDAAGKLADGREFNGSVELVNLLATRKNEIRRHFAEKLLTYALGRGLEPYDNCALDEIMQSAAENEYRISAFVTAVVESEPFSKRRATKTSALAGP